MIAKKLSLTEVQKFHGDLLIRIMEEIKAEKKKISPEKIEWAYSYELVSDTDSSKGSISDARELGRHVDRKIRKAKLQRIQNILYKKAKGDRPEEINETLKNFFSNVIALSLFVKADKFERYYKIEKTSLFESKIKENIESGDFVY